jgi:hypothetical protein
MASFASVASGIVRHPGACVDAHGRPRRLRDAGRATVPAASSSVRRRIMSDVDQLAELSSMGLAPRLKKPPSMSCLTTSARGLTAQVRSR